MNAQAPTAERPAAIDQTQDPVEAVAAALRAHNIEAVVVETGAQARDIVLGLVPIGAEVHSGKSKTLDDIGLYAELMESGRYDAIRPRLVGMDRTTQAREIRKLSAAPDVMVGSVEAITADGTLVAASATGSQLGPFAYGAGRVILVAGSQRIVPDLDAALRRVREVVLPWENARIQERMGVDTMLAKVLLLHGEWASGRTTVVLVREPLGV